MIAKKYKNRNSGGKAFFSFFSLFLLMFFIGFLVFTNWRINQKRANLEAQIDILNKQYSGLKERNESLKSGLSNVTTESYLEEEARERLGFQKPGEKVVSVIGEEPLREENNSSGENLWEKILGWFASLKSKIPFLRD